MHRCPGYAAALQFAAFEKKNFEDGRNNPNKFGKKCRLGKSEKDLPPFTVCDSFYKCNKKGHVMINMLKGDYDLTRMLEQKDDFFETDDMLKAFRSLFEGIVKMRKVNVVHQDIKYHGIIQDTSQN